ALAAAHSALDAAGGELPEKPAAFNSTGLMEVNQEDNQPVDEPAPEAVPERPVDVAIDPATGMLSYPTNLVPPSNDLPTDPGNSSVIDPTAPPTVPPPMAFPPLMPPFDAPIDGTLPPPSQ
ncbi:hypothetical protein H0X10_00840, partial [Candidatus Saccharibacteria bacterium]|nr:hypothetical protein [Candidatus Saccharibacteria bacterium]